MTFLSAGQTNHGCAIAAPGFDDPHRGALAGLRHAIGAALAWVAAGRIENQLVASLEGLRRRAMDGALGDIGVGLRVTNTSAHRLEYELTAMRMILDGRQGARPVRSILRGQIAPGRTGLLAECTTAMGPLGAGQTLQGSFEFTLRYGLRGAARHRLCGGFAMAFKSGPADQLAAFTWYPI